MFDLIVKGRRTTTRRDVVPLVASWAVHVLVPGAIVLVPLLFAADHLPAVPKQVLTYVAVSAPPPPPRPPAAPTPAPAVKRPSQQAVRPPRPVSQAPVVAPRELPPAVETADAGDDVRDFDTFDGVAGGIALRTSKMFRASMMLMWAV